MYNSGAKYPSYRDYSYSREFSLPENYSGSTFVPHKEQAQKEESSSATVPEVIYEAEPVAEADEEDAKDVFVQSGSDTPVGEGTEQREQTERKDESQQVSARTHGKDSKGGFFDLGRLFGGNFNVGFEELLIIALILLLGKDAENEDIIILLAILLFIN